MTTEIVEWQPTCPACPWEGDWMEDRAASYEAIRAHVNEAHPEWRQWVFDRSRRRTREA